MKQYTMFTSFHTHLQKHYPDLGEFFLEEILQQGRDNMCFLIKNTRHEYFVVKQYMIHGASYEHILAESEIMWYGYTAGLPIPKIVKNKNSEYITTIDGFFIQITHFIHGDHQDYDLYTVREIGMNMGRIHQLYKVDKFQDTPIRKSIWSDLGYFGELHQFLPEVLPYVENSVKNIYLRYFELYEKRQHIYTLYSRGIIHNDFCWDNLLFQDKKLTGITDFTDFTYSFYIQDIAIFLGHVFFSFGGGEKYLLAKKYFFNGYDGENLLSSEEKGSITEFIIYRYIQNSMEGIMAGDMHYTTSQTHYLKDFYTFSSLL